MFEVPPDNPLTEASVALGRRLFFDGRLSRPAGTSCASCHFPDRAFADTAALSTGSTGLTGMRNSPSLGNVAYHRRLFRDGGVPSLEMQVLAPIHDEKEMDSDINVVSAQLRHEPEYDRLSRLAYRRPLDPWVITRAIASYERTLLSGWSRYDRFRNGDATALTAQEQEGLALFESPALNCTGCHGGFDLSQHEFHNIGTTLDYSPDPGRQRITLLAADEGRFKVPSLRNVALTAPYMHDGSMATLEEVIDHFASGGLPHPNRSPLMQPFALDAQQKAALIAFLQSLTDERPLDPSR
jgi:cytochrome c peroxidase